MQRPCEIPYRIERLQFIDFTKDYQNGLIALTQILSRISISEPPLTTDRPTIVDIPPTPELPMQIPISHSRQISRVRIISAISIIAALALLIYLLIKGASNDDSRLVNTETQSKSDSAEMKKLDTDTLSKAQEVSTYNILVDTSALKVPSVSAAQNSSSKSIVAKGELKANKATKWESKFLGSYPLIFTSQGSQFPVACDASGEYAVYEDHVVVTFSNMKITYLGQERFPSSFKEERNIEALPIDAAAGPLPGIFL